MKNEKGFHAVLQPRISIEMLKCANSKSAKNAILTCLINQNRSQDLIKKWRASLTLQETRSIHDSMNIPKIEFISYIYILL